jgi:hypothetical protein
VLNLVWRLDGLPPGDDGVSSSQGQEAPVSPVPEFLPRGTKLIHLLPGVRIEMGVSAEDFAGTEIGVGHGLVPSTLTAVDR